MRRRHSPLPSSDPPPEWVVQQARDIATADVPGSDRGPSICAQRALVDQIPGVAKRVAVLPGMRPGWRYFSAFACGLPINPQLPSQGICLIFKDARFESFVGMVASVDGMHFSPPRVLLNASWEAACMTHNLAILQHRGEFLIVGGQDNSRRDEHCRRHNVGVHLASSGGVGRRPAPLAPLLPADAAQRWSRPRLLLNGSHPGCVEERPQRKFHYLRSIRKRGRRVPACEFDGRFSLSHHRRSLLLYARANPAKAGHRFVQVARSLDPDGAAWGPFEMLRMQGYQLEGDVYFWGAQSNPVHPESLIGIFPLYHRGRGCVALASSWDGVSWSHATPLTHCKWVDPRLQRTMCQPALGMVRQADRVLVYQHQPVDMGDLYAANQLGPPRLIVYSIPAAALLQWTTRALHGLDRDGRAEGGVATSRRARGGAKAQARVEY